MNLRLQPLSLLLSFFLIYSCSGRKQEAEDTSEVKYSEEVAKVISHITAGRVLPTSTITITFIEPVVKQEELLKEIDNPFSFSPSISGSAKWVEKNKLEFKPEKPLSPRVNYTGSVDVAALSEDFKGIEVNLKFYVEGMELNSFKAELELENPSNPQKLIYKGKIAFSQNVSLQAIQDAASFSDIGLNWNQETDKSFSFVSGTILRQSETKKYTFKLNGKALNLLESLEKYVEVVPLEKIKLTKIDKDEQGKTPKLMLQFSDQLDLNQDLNGFVSITPETNFKIQQLGKYLILDGDFKFGNEYEISIKSGLKSKWGSKTDQPISEKVKFSDIQPQVEFSSNGIFLPTSNNKRVQFLTTNVKRVHVEIKKVFDENVDAFFRNENLNSAKNRNSEFKQSYVSSVGAIIYNQTLEIGDSKNEWLLHELALDNVFKDYSNGLYLIRINFNPRDILVPIKGSELGHIQKNGQIYKPITISDIGLIAKRFDNNQRYQIYTTDLKTGKPLSGVKVSSANYSSTHDTGTTNESGRVVLTGRRGDYIRAEKGGQISIINPNSMEWNKSGFDVGGVSSRDLETRAFTYTERGVYRPGDSINMSCIIRHNTSQSVSNAPADLMLYNPEGTLVHEQTQKNAVDGFYNFSFGTDQNDPTGNWSAQIRTGNKRFYHTLKIETVVANRIKVKVTPALKKLLPENRQLQLEIESKYLFGASAKGLAYESEVEVFEVHSAFPKFQEFSFFNQYIDFQNIKSKINEGNLDQNGNATITWNVPYLSQAPSPLKAKITATVQEEGGRPNNAWTFVDLHPFSHYVGIKNTYSYVKLNSKNNIPVVVVNHDGEAAAGRELIYRIYRNDSYWWYQYNSFRDFKLRYKTDKHSHLIEDGVVTSGKPHATVPFQPAQSGQYLIEVQDAVSGHISSVFMSAYPYGGIPSGDQNAGTLMLKSEKESYEVGDEATISFPSPKQGNVLLTVEKADRIILSKWIDPTDAEDMKVKLEITRAMVPNAYVTVTVLQTHSQTVNDRPIRMFGILPIDVIDPGTKQELVIKMPDELKPKQGFDVEISALDGKQTQFTIAIVDEGLLDLTNFQTPNPWKEFFKKVRLEVETFDMFAFVIGANESDVFKTFSIGGDEDYRESQLDPFKKKKRFKPVCMFQGPLKTDSQGKAKVHFEMPNYIGSVRVMVVGASGNTYSSTEKTVTVKSDLVVQPTIPRALKPGDEFTIPVNVFATKGNIGKVNLTIDTEGPLEVVGSRSIPHTFVKEDDKLFYFKVKVKPAVGQAKITITCSGSGVTSSYDADVPVSPSAARIYEKAEKIIKPGETISLDLPTLGIDGTNNARLSLSVFPNMDFTHRLQYLIRYPYGCIEQTTSSVYPQLALKDLLGGDTFRQKEIDKNINDGISRLRTFQLGDGGFSYWPGGQEASEWGSNYATQFLIEARKQGYVVPDNMYDEAIRYLDRQSRRTSDEEKQIMTRINRCYVLALGGKAPINEMNLLKQNHYAKMNSVQQWQLVACYKLAGAVDKVQDLIGKISTEVKEYNEFSHTYGSRHRDLGIILRCLVILERKNDAALMAKYVAEVLSNNNWYSTQTVGQMLLGIGAYFDYAGIKVNSDLIIEGEVILPNGKKEVIKSVNKYALYINEGYGNELKLKLNSDVDVSQLYVTVSSNGVPLTDNTKEVNKNIALETKWYNEDGEIINIAQINQGETFYGHFRVKNTSVVPRIDEVALVQLLPSGWEIENMRLTNEVLPVWMSSWKTGKEEYLDIRDDRIMWFFDLYNSQALDFVVKINAITQGKYQLPGARCEAMYNADYVATKESKTVEVVKKSN